MGIYSRSCDYNTDLTLKLYNYTGGNPVEIEQKNRSSLLEKAINAYCNVYYSYKKIKS